MKTSQDKTLIKIRDNSFDNWLPPYKIVSTPIPPKK